ncbi:MAG TPA: hypothetical protein VM492_12950 [Sumerlaeia bacterium]|nr:hypothetical protein [Sumerlaeia bacterium]
MPSSSQPILKPKQVFRDASRAYRRKRRRGYLRMLADCAGYVCGFPRDAERAGVAPTPFAPHALDPLFFGMNVCPSPDPAGDAIQIEALRDLGARAVRIDYGAKADRGPADRFLERLLGAGFPVTLHLVQDPYEACAMADDPSQRRRWRDFVDAALGRYGQRGAGERGVANMAQPPSAVREGASERGKSDESDAGRRERLDGTGRVEAIEVGSTPNRHSWSGYTLADYAAASRVAREALDAWSASHRDLEPPLLLGPNISDFAPYFTIGQLAECRRAGVRFDVMTDNLFVDRVGEPEAHDPHVLGKALRGLHRLDLARKQQSLAAIGRRFGAARSWCAYMHYTLCFGRPRRRHVTPEQYANYMVRAHILTAAAGCFERLYWGTLVDHYKGLIDETARVRPYPPFVHHRFAVDGPPSEWKRRDDFFRAYSTLTRHLAGRRFVRRYATEPDVFVFEFADEEGSVFAGWTRDGRERSLDAASVSSGKGVSERIDRGGNALEPGDAIPLAAAPVWWR